MWTPFSASVHGQRDDGDVNLAKVKKFCLEHEFFFFQYLDDPVTCKTSLTTWQILEEVYGVNIISAANEEKYIPEQLAEEIAANSDTVSRIGFIGLGAMGFGMATHLLKSNYCVSGFDVISHL